MSDSHSLEAVVYEAKTKTLKVLDQKSLPQKHVYIDVRDIDGGFEVIKNMNVRIKSSKYKT